MITDLRINAKGELEGKVIPPAKWEEMYTKNEVAVILTELQLKIEELDSRAGYSGGMPTFSTDYIRKKKVNELIQQKINALREGEL